VTYWTRIDSSGTTETAVGALHRRQHAVDSEGEDSGSVVAWDLGYAVAGLRLDAPQDLAKAIAYAEFLARGRGHDCLTRFGDQLTPSLVKAAKPESRALHRSLRMIFNVALVSVARNRQAAALANSHETSYAD
jgi:hypothetical protein